MPAGPACRFNAHSSGPGTCNCLHPSQTQGAKGRRLALSRASQTTQGTASRQPQAQAPGPPRPVGPAGRQPSGAPPRGQSGGLGKAQRQCGVVFLEAAAGCQPSCHWGPGEHTQLTTHPPLVGRTTATTPPVRVAGAGVYFPHSTMSTDTKPRPPYSTLRARVLYSNYDNPGKSHHAHCDWSI